MQVLDGRRPARKISFSASSIIALSRSCDPPVLSAAFSDSAEYRQRLEHAANMRRHLLYLYSHDWPVLSAHQLSA